MVKKKNIQEIASVAEPIVIEESSSTGSLRRSLEEVKTYEGVIGYILRNSTSAAIDLGDPTRIIDYAILSSSAFDANKELSELFDLGNTKSILIEAKSIKVLSLLLDDSRVSIFMDRNADHKKIMKKLHVL